MALGIQDSPCQWRCSSSAFVIRLNSHSDQIARLRRALLPICWPESRLERGDPSQRDAVLFAEGGNFSSHPFASSLSANLAL
jgi:hypothetical protein